MDDFLMTTRCGTPGYVAPEVLAQEVSHASCCRRDTHIGASRPHPYTPSDPTRPRLASPRLALTLCHHPVPPSTLGQVTHGQLRKYGTSCDMWSVGVIVYILLSAAPPFYGKTDAEMNRRIKLGQYRFPDKYWASISQVT
jgi:serine/threonine protein kinase